MRHPVLIDTVEALAEALAREVDQLARTTERHGRFALAVPGGSVAAMMLPRLSEARIDWSRTDVFFVDERAVPPTDPESNWYVAHAILVERGPVAADRLHRMAAGADDLDSAAATHERELRSLLREPPRLDLVLLGMGPDGHVASLFPGHAAIEVRDRWVVAEHNSPKPPRGRLTLTLPVLTAGDLVVVAAFGPEKAGAIRDAIENPGSDLPIARVLQGARNARILLDPDAAALLRS